MFGDIVSEEDFGTIGSDGELIMWLDPSFWRHEGRIGEDDIVFLSPEFLIREGVIFCDFWRLESMEIEIDPSDLRHTRIDIDSCDTLSEPRYILDSEISLGSDMLECFDEESCCTTCRIEDRLRLVWIDDIYEELDDMSWCTK